MRLAVSDRVRRKVAAMDSTLSHETTCERPDLLLPWVIILAASAGGLNALAWILGSLPFDLPAAVVVIQHRSPTGPSALRHVLARRSRLPVLEAQAGMPIRPGLAYLVAPDRRLIVTPDGRFADGGGTRVRDTDASVHPLLESASRVFDGRVIAVVLSGSGRDGADGVQRVKGHGGVVFAPDEASADYRDMPQTAIRTGSVDRVLPLEDIASMLVKLVGGQRLNETKSAR